MLRYILSAIGEVRLRQTHFEYLRLIGKCHFVDCDHMHAHADLSVGLVYDT